MFIDNVEGKNAKAILEYYRDSYIAKSENTEQQIIANAINDVLAEYENRISSYRQTISEIAEDRSRLIQQNEVLTNRVRSLDAELRNTQYFITEQECRQIVSEMLEGAKYNENTEVCRRTDKTQSDVR